MLDPNVVFNDAKTQIRAFRISGLPWPPPQGQLPLQPTQRGQAIANEIIRAEETTQGQFLNVTINTDTGDSYYFDGVSRQLIPIMDRNRMHAKFAAHIYHRYDVIATDPLSMHMLAVLDAYARRAGATEVHRFCYWDVKNKLLYLSRYNGTTYKIDGDQIKIVNNGTDGILFLEDGKATSVEADIGHHGGVLSSLTHELQYTPLTEGGLQPDHQQLLLAVWLHAVAFPEMIKSKPILALYGDMGSGKTMALRRMQIALSGVDRVLILDKSANVEDFGLQLLRNHICLLDQVDVMIDWLPQALTSYVTGGEWLRRKRFSDIDESKVKPNSFLCVSTRNPASLYQADVADRLIVLRLDRRDEKQFGSESKLLEDIANKRPQIYGEWLHNLNKIVAVLRTNPELPPSKHRLADFAAIAYIAGQVLGYSKEKIAEALELLQAERGAFVEENDQVAPVLEHWLSFETNQGLEVTITELFQQLTKMAIGSDIPWRLRSAQALRRHLAETREGLKTKFILKEIKDPKRKTTLYQFWTK